MSDDKSTVWCVSVQVPTAQVDAFADALSPHCDALSWLEVGAGAEVRLSGYSPAPPDAALLDGAVRAAATGVGMAAPAVKIETMQPRDWVMESLKTFPPVRAGGYYIHGSHVGGARPWGEVALQIDAGAAFGTGSHESTSGCLGLMGQLARRRTFARILDVGCGSGILALAAVKTWAGAHVQGFDIDARAIHIARENAVVNGLRSRISFFVSGGYHHPAIRCGGYDLILSNILARPLMRLARGLVRNLAPGGVCVLSGFLVRDERRVLAAHRMQGLCLVGRIEQNGWVALALAKRRGNRALLDEVSRGQPKPERLR